MSSPIDVQRLITQYLKQYKNPSISYSQLLTFTERYLQQNELENPHMQDLRQDAHRTLSHHLRSLEQNGKIEIQKSQDQPVSIFYELYFHEKIRNYYKKIMEDFGLPLATEENLSLEIPEERIQAIDIKKEFVEWLSKDLEKPRIIRILFPAGLKSLVTTSALLKKEMISASIQKIRQYLQQQRNHSYISQKLVPIFKGREVAVKDLMRIITQSPEAAARTVVEASEFSFQVWTQLSTFIIKEYESKSDKMEEEHNFCQAAYMIGYYCVFHKGKEQKKKDEAGALKYLEQNMKKPPYAFTLTEIKGMKDDKGIPLLKKYSRESLNEFLEAKTTTPEKAALPELLRLQLPDDSQVYMFASSVGKVLENQRVRASKQFRDFYKNSWYSAMMENDRLDTMDDDEKFRIHVTNRLRERYPLLFTLLRFELLYLLSQERSTPDALKNQCIGFLDMHNETIKDIDEILELDRRKILSDARILLPFWMSIPILRGIVHLFRRIFLGRDFVDRYHSERFDHEQQKSLKKKKSSQKVETITKQFGTARPSGGQNDTGSVRRDDAPGSTPADSGSSSTPQTAKAQKAAFKQQIQRLEPEFLDRGKSLEMSLRELVDKWNPILDQAKRKDLVEDVNSMCRDFIRGLRITYRSTPPDADTIKEMAHRLAGNSTFDRIRDRNYLEQYIQLYFLKILGR
ncbi:hypothetical protein [Salinispira pacifica]|uniref:Uncharacterized protein n=1 Tax=Salinispira pacifica TaxID=1307761 RepID=V5WFV1_9SPIO|nr:hypothetical protein [Salinispira pacifica]AHC14668.1 hypothetical protein L21SP2_1267 [Salinispira pacifica]